MATDGSALPLSDAAPLSFDAPHRDAPPAAMNCAMCGQSIRSVYYETSGNILCTRCRGKLESEIGSAGKGGRLLRACAYGLAAGAAGSAVYYAVAAVTGMTIGLIAILVGFIVGKAVFVGSGKRGGRGYQFLALGLTYFAIASSYIPLARHEIQKKVARARSDSALVLASKATDDDSLSAAADSAPAPVVKPHKAEHRGFVGTMKIAAGLVILSAVLPVLIGLASPITVLILVFGLLQAWRMNRRAVATVTGPYRLTQPSAPLPTI